MAQLFFFQAFALSTHKFWQPQGTNLQCAAALTETFGKDEASCWLFTTHVCWDMIHLQSPLCGVSWSVGGKKVLCISSITEIFKGDISVAQILREVITKAQPARGREKSYLQRFSLNAQPWLTPALSKVCRRWINNWDEFRFLSSYNQSKLLLNNVSSREHVQCPKWLVSLMYGPWLGGIQEHIITWDCDKLIILKQTWLH